MSLLLLLLFYTLLAHRLLNVFNNSWFTCDCRDIIFKITLVNNRCSDCLYDVTVVYAFAAGCCPSSVSVKRNVPLKPVLTGDGC